jgi:hypothetical protein
MLQRLLDTLDSCAPCSCLQRLKKQMEVELKRAQKLEARINMFHGGYQVRGPSTGGSLLCIEAPKIACFCQYFFKIPAVPSYSFTLMLNVSVTLMQRENKLTLLTSCKCVLVPSPFSN